MAAKSANLYARIEPEVKEEAEKILFALGIPASSAINMYYKQIILHRGIPFPVELPLKSPINIGALSKEELDLELEKGYQDAASGRTKPAAEVFSNIRADYEI